MNKACDAISTSSSAACEPLIMSHDSYAPGIEYIEADGSWRVTDAEEPVWTESNWPADMHATLYPHGAPRSQETLLLLVCGVASTGFSYIAVVLSRQAHKQSYKRL